MGTFTIILIIVTVALSYKGFTDHRFVAAMRFDVGKILVNKQYRRLVTSGFIHVSWMHLLFNMISLYFFSRSLEFFLGGGKFLIVYFAGLIGGNLLSLLIHRRHGDYRSVGASGAVWGTIFASIALFPGLRIGLFGPFLQIPGWIYGLAFILYSIYGIRSKRDNIGHEAHLGGALIGMITALLMVPSALTANFVTIAIITVPTIIFIYLIIAMPHLLFVDNFFFKTHEKNYTIDQRYNVEKATKQQTIDQLLDKIHKKGMGSLSKKERDLLNEYSKKS